MAVLSGAVVPLLLVGVLGGVGDALKPHVLVQAEFYQRTEGPDTSAAQFVFQWDGDELFHVELSSARTVWRLPEFGRFASFEAQGALQNMAVGKQNLDTMMHNANRSQDEFVAPEVAVFTEDPVELGEPNVLICMADKFWPPNAEMGWKKNGAAVSGGVAHSVYYGRADLRFQRFSYLPFVPQRGDMYTCSVQHWGAAGPIERLWEPEVSVPPSQSWAVLLCAVGLAFGVVGVAVGTALIVRTVRRGARGNGGLL